MTHLALRSYVYPGFDLDAWAEIEMRLGRTMEDLRKDRSLNMGAMVAGVKVDLKPTVFKDPWVRLEELKKEFGDRPFLFWVLEDELHAECEASLKKVGA